MEIQAFDSKGRTAGRDILGVTMYTCVVWVVNMQMVLAISYFTMIQHIFIWGTIAFWYLFLLIYGAMPPGFSKNAYYVLIETLASSPMYWLVTFFVVISTLIPYFCYSALQMRFFPMYHEKIQWLRHKGKANDAEYCALVRQKSLGHVSVGSTARLEAKKANQRKSRTSNHK